MRPVIVAVVERASMALDLPLSGTVMARRTSSLSPQVDGLVSELLVDEGDRVKRGHVLLRLDKVTAEFSLKRAAAARDEARAKLSEAIRKRDEASVLVQKKHIAKTVYASKIADVHIGSAALERLKAEYGLQAELLKRHEITAPFDGVIGKKRVEVGQWVETGESVLELVEIDALRVDVAVPQRHFADIRAGTAASLRFDAKPGRVVEGRVDRIIPVAEPAGRTFPVRIEMDNRELLVAPAMSARVLFHIEAGGEALVLPRDAIVEAPDGSSTVWVVVENAGELTVSPRIVSTGRASRNKMEIVGGEINVGDRVVVRGNEILTPGQGVRIAGNSR